MITGTRSYSGHRQLTFAELVRWPHSLDRGEIVIMAVTARNPAIDFKLTVLWL